MVAEKQAKLAAKKLQAEQAARAAQVAKEQAETAAPKAASANAETDGATSTSVPRFSQLVPLSKQQQKERCLVMQKVLENLGPHPAHAAGRTQLSIRKALGNAKNFGKDPQEAINTLLGLWQPCQDYDCASKIDAYFDASANWLHCQTNKLTQCFSSVSNVVATFFFWVV